MKLRLRPRSLKKQLLLSLLSALLMVWGLMVYASYQQTRDQITQLFNAELAQSARVVHAFVENLLQQRRLTKLWDQEKSPDLFSMPILGQKYERKIAFQLRSVKEGVVLRSESAPEFALSLTRNGYSETSINNQLWHVFSISSENGDYIIHVGQRDDIRHELVASLANQQVLAMLLALPVLGVVIGVIVSRTLKPVNRLKEQLASRQVGHLKPLPLNRLPEEVVPMVQQINALFELLEQAFANERNFTSDASHELKTPLAGMMTQLQVAQKAQDEGMRNQALQKCQQAVMRMTHMVQQLLTLSRVQHHNVQLSKQKVDINQAVIAVIAEIEFSAHEKNIEIELSGQDGLAIEANPQLLSILLRNLLDNAIKYTPADGKVNVIVQQDLQRVCFIVEDSGPGVADQDYERISQRFYRCVETAQSAEGSGLGLSIVQRIIRLHAASIRFSKSGLGGLNATLWFDLADLSD
ncbi:MAG: two-component sensor histidine kinase [Methylomonas sp.]|nr:MAG: two-component sensor histidine kinase [Methylomonas sp.]